MKRGSEVVVNLKTGTAFRGVMLRSFGQYVILVKAEMIRDSDGFRTPVDGEAWIDRRDVEFIQRLGGNGWRS